MIGQPITGARYLLRGLHLITQPGLRRFVILPVLINVLVFTLLISLVAGQFGALIDQWLPTLPDWLSWLNYLLWTLFAVTAAVFVFFSFTLLANLIAAPFNGLLAEAVERYLTGHELPSGSSFLQVLKDAPAAMFDELGKMLYFLIWVIPLLIISWIPPFSLVAPVLWVLFSAWMLAVEYADYPMGNHGLKGKEQRAILRSKRFQSLGFGGLTMAGTVVPVVNLIIMPTAVAGATAMWVESLNTRGSDIIKQ